MKQVSVMNGNNVELRMKHVGRRKAAQCKTSEKGKGSIGKWYVYQVYEREKL